MAEVCKQGAFRCGQSVTNEATRKIRKILRRRQPLVPFEYGFNPSYLHVMQFAVDELAPRMGIRAMAQLYFTRNSDGLAACLQPG